LPEVRVSDELERIRKARGKFTAMAAAFFLGVFNDNFYKQAVLVLAVAAGRTALQGIAILVFTLPFLVFAAPAGWASDRFPKRSVVITAKVVELAAMAVGAVGIALGSWPLILVMLGTMGTQATFMSPAVNGSIPDLYPESHVTRANGVLRMVVTLGILSGIALAGFALDRPGTGFHGLENGRLYVGAWVVLVALGGLATSVFIARNPAADPGAAFPWTGPLVTLRDLAGIRRDPLLAFTVCASVFIWFSGSLQVLLINPLGLQELGLSKSLTSALIVSQLLGIATGGLLSPRWARGERWHRVLAPAGAGMGLAMLALPALSWLPGSARLPGAFVLVGLIGLFGGLFLIPVESFIQTRPPAARRGAILAAANFAVFGGIMLSGPLSNFFNAHWVPTTGMGLVGGFSLLLSAGIAVLLRRAPWA
jgi:acyl-[acyl-carrier-protein]-phospholipid O-acyltransferase/long-chain-fatty-acid--[acyl-carrier-protein] ligase